MKFILSTVLFAALILTAEAQPAQRPPNIVFFPVDDQRTQDFEFQKLKNAMIHQQLLAEWREKVGPT